MAKAEPTPRKAGAKAGAKRKPAKKATAKRSEAQRRRASSAKRKAEQAEAKRVGKELELAGEGLTGAAKTVENAELYLKVFGDWLKGYTYVALAARHKLSIGRIEQIVGDLRGKNLNVMRLRDPRLGQRIAHDLILKLSASISDYAELAENTGNESVKLGALRQKDAQVESFKDLMQELGYLPKHLGTLRIVENWDAMIEAMLEAMDAKGIPIDVQRFIVESAEKVNDRAPLGDVDSTAEEVTDAVLAA